MKADFAAVRGEAKADSASLRASIELRRPDMTIKLGSMIFIAVGVMLTAMRFMPPRL